ncbi:MAG: hypothetical protein WBC80_25665 [Isosphaeraceae bacterium]
MFRKLLKLVTMLTLLAGCYLGYVRAFTVVMSHLTAARRVDDIPFIVKDSKSKQEAILHARESFGPKHWTADDDLQLRYYNSERGFWMYSQHDDRVIEEDGVRYDGKRIKLRPAAIISRAKDGSSTKTVTAEEAIIDLNQPLSFNAKPDAEPIVVKHARLERNVMIRDDRGTLNDRADDLLIGPLTWVEFDDNKLQLNSDSDVLIVDRDTQITGAGMLIQLRPKSESGLPGAHSSGFEGAQSAQINQNVHVLFTDVGKTGILPDTAQTKRGEPGKVEVKVDTQRAQKNGATKDQASPEPVPLDLRCDGPMHVAFPKPHLPVKEGPPAPPGPTLVHFERNVVVRRGKLTEQPDQLDSDNLDLTLVPAEKTAPGPGKAPSTGSQAVTVAVPSASSGQAPAAEDAASSGSGEQKGMLGDLVLQRAKATGHAVWLRSPAKGVRIFCNELLHKIAAPAGPNLTYWRSDPTRKVIIEKYDYVEERPQGPDGPVVRKPQSVTHIWTVDATMVDSGSGMETANLFAHGPGLLETRPIPDKMDSPLKDVPPDRTAVWQDLMMLKNLLGPDQKIVQKELVLKGYPRVVDRLKQQSLDAVDTIVVWLKPKPAESTPAKSATAKATSAQKGQGDSSAEGGNFQIQRLLALRDVHLVAPSKNLTARDRLDADFKEAPSSTIATRTTAQGTSQPAAEASPSAAAGGADTKTDEPEIAAQEKEPEPAMVALANRVEADILIDPKTETKSSKKDSTVKTTKTSSTSSPGDPDSDYEVRDLRLFGKVWLHQDPSPGKTKGQEASGEKLILHSEGPGRAVIDLYDRQDPENRKLARATPRPPAKVVTEDMTIEGQVVGLDQTTDRAWAFGPGKLVQLTDRGLLSDKAEGEEARPTDRADADAGAESSSKPKDAQTIKPKPRTRAGKVQTEKVPLVVTWGEKMLFYGKSLDPENRPAAKAEFYKNVRAEMEDGLLLCTKIMTTYTDQPIPLAELGKMSQAGSGSGAKAKTNRNAADGGAEAEKPKPDLTLIDLVGNAVAISRKVDPEKPVLLSLQKVTSEHLIYDRRTGDFQSPCAGMVYLYDKADDPEKSKGPDGEAPVANRRPIRPVAGKPGDKPGGKAPVLPLVLTQIKFTREMIGRFGTGKTTDKTATRWADFFGDIESARTPVANVRTIVNYDRLPPDTYFLTSQTMRVVSEPPPPGSPENAPARNFLKAWENAYATTNDTMIQADVITYDSHNDLIYANGQEGRLVQVVQQVGPGQLGSPMRADAVRVNPKTGAADVIGPHVLQMLDKKTGTRPTPVAPPDPNAKPAKPRKNPYRPPANNVERKGFTGK